MNKYCLCTIFVLLVLLDVQCRQNKGPLAQIKEKVQERKTVVESNHFSSNYQKNTSYQINGIELNKSLILVLKDPTHAYNDSKLTDNPINITITSGSQNQTCEFKSYRNLCAFESVNAKDMTMLINCTKTPCQLSWMIIQPPKKDVDGEQQLNHLVQINKDNNHANLKVTCANPELLESFASSLFLYSNNKFQKMLSKKGIAHFLFNSQEKGFYFLTSEDHKVIGCAKATLIHAQENVPFNNNNFTQRDFVSKNYPVTYNFQSVPDTDFRMDFSAHDILFQELSNATSLSYSLNGYKNNKKTQIGKIAIALNDEKQFIDFSLVTKKLKDKYDTIELNINSEGNTLEFQAKFYASDLHQIQLGETSFFAMQKGQKLKFKLVPAKEDKDLSKKANINIDPAIASKFKASVSQCNATIGCQFQIQALQSGNGNIYIGQKSGQNKKQIIVVPFEQNSITKYIRYGQTAFFSHKIKKDGAFQLMVNTPNVLVYCSSKDKCKPNDEDKCYEKVFSYHHPSIYESTKDDQILFKVVSLDDSEMTLSIMDQHSPYVSLSDNVPFAYLFDDKQTSLIFRFQIPKKVDVSFNLIAPNNQLSLLVMNKQKVDQIDKQKADWASDGYVKFNKKQLNSTVFFIQVKKRQFFDKNFIHFSLLASTTETNLRLQPGITHYDNLNPNEKRYLVFEFQKHKKIFLNMYNHNLQSKVNVQMTLSNIQQYSSKKQNQTAVFVIDQQVDVMDIQLVSSKLCAEQDTNCELFIQLFNKMDVQVDISITLMIQEAIIQLKDGIWQSFDINSASITSHFYFTPNYPDHSTTIFYKSTIVDLKILYTLWQSDDKSINPTEWPFPLEFKSNQSLSQVHFKPLQYIHIEPNSLKKCWPNCIVLLSIAPDTQTFKDKKFKIDQITNQYFKIMASNSFVQLPENHKINMALVKDESKNFLVDLKYHQNKEQIAFEIYFNLGNQYTTSFKVNVYSEKNPRCPSKQDTADFQLNGYETIITMSDIKDKLSQNSIDVSQAYLCVNANAFNTNKFSIQWTSSKDDIKNIAIDNTVTLASESNAVHLYRISANQETYLKIVRSQGFPYVKTNLCNPKKKQVSKCIQQFTADQQKGIQLADKVTSFSQIQTCDNCVLFIKITSLEPSKIDIHVQSKYAQVELKEAIAVYDSLNKDEQNRYSLTGSKQNQININVQIIAGDLQIAIYDFQQISIKKNNTKGSKNINVIVPPKDLKKKTQQNGVASMSQFALSSLINLHIVVSSTDSKLGAQYIITYTSGESIIFLQDGLISQYNIVAKKSTKFIYQNTVQTQNNRGIYLHTATTNAEELKKLKVQIYGLDDPEDEESKVLMTPQQMDYHKKTPNPTMLVKLPFKKSYIFSVENNNDKNVLYTLGINNIQIMYLPFDHELPIQLKQGQFIYIVVSSQSAGYIKLNLKKCDQSQAEIAYTLNYNQFVNQLFQNQQEIGDQLNTQLIVKTKGQGGLYIKLSNKEFDYTITTIQAIFSPTKISPSRSKPGDKGLIQYQLLDSTKAQLTFTSIVCNSNDKSCNKDFSYVAISADNADQIYAQLVCSAIMYDLPQVQHLKAPTITNISSSTKSTKITFTLAINNESQFVGIRATNSKSKEIVYYRPIEILTFWGRVHKSNSNSIILVILGLVLVCGGMCIYRRYRKSKEQNYESLRQVNDEI